MDYDERNFLVSLWRPDDLYLEFLDLFSGQVTDYPWRSEVSRKLIEEFPEDFNQEILVRGNLIILHLWHPDTTFNIVAALELKEEEEEEQFEQVLYWFITSNLQSRNSKFIREIIL